MVLATVVSGAACVGATFARSVVENVDSEKRVAAFLVGAGAAAAYDLYVSKLVDMDKFPIPRMVSVPISLFATAMFEHAARVGVCKALHITGPQWLASQCSSFSSWEEACKLAVIVAIVGSVSFEIFKRLESQDIQTDERT